MDKKQLMMMGLKMNIAMGVALSFVLSLQGNLLSGHFTVPGWLISFGVSLIISFIICLIIPMKKVNDTVIQKSGMDPNGLPCKFLLALVSDCIFTPIMTFVMVFIAYKGAVKGGAQVPFIPMFLKSLLFSMITAYICIFILQPVFIKMFMPKDAPIGPEVNIQED